MLNAPKTQNSGPARDMQLVIATAKMIAAIQEAENCGEYITLEQSRAELRQLEEKLNGKN
jgi:hypothetical protein